GWGVWPRPWLGAWGAAWLTPEPPVFWQRWLAVGEVGAASWPGGVPGRAEPGESPVLAVVVRGGRSGRCQMPDARALPAGRRTGRALPAGRRTGRGLPAGRRTGRGDRRRPGASLSSDQGRIRGCARPRPPTGG